MKKYFLLSVLLLLSISLYAQKFNPAKDIIALHYDHAPDLDDGHSATADRVILQSTFGKKWLNKHLIIVSGTYGLNSKTFVSSSDKLMNVVWNGQWISAHHDWKASVQKSVAVWVKTIHKGGLVWIKEGGQSDFTADVIKQIKVKHPQINTKESIICVQHSNWNEDQTTPKLLAYTKENSKYIRIEDANAYCVIKRNDPAIVKFVDAALSNPTNRKYWEASFIYFPALGEKGYIDYSDTGELMHILGLGKMDVENFRNTYLKH